jgi:hypothetical protein
LLNQSITFISSKNHFKTWNQHEIQNLPDRKFVLLGIFKKKKLIWTLLIKWNHLEQIYCFDGWNRSNGNFFFSKPESGNFLFLLSLKKDQKIIKMKFDIEIKFSIIGGTRHLTGKKKWGTQMYFLNKIEGHLLFYPYFLF